MISVTNWISCEFGTFFKKTLKFGTFELKTGPFLTRDFWFLILKKMSWYRWKVLENWSIFILFRVKWLKKRSSARIKNRAIRGHHRDTGTLLRKPGYVPVFPGQLITLIIYLIYEKLWFYHHIYRETRSKINALNSYH